MMSVCVTLVVDNLNGRGYTIKVSIPIEDRLPEAFIFKANGSKIGER